MAVAVLALGAAAVLAGCERGTPPPEHLIKLIQKVETGTFDKLDVRGEFDRSAGLIHFRLQYLHTGDGNAAGYIVDPVDQTPLVAMVGDTTVVYDQQTDELIIVRGTRPMLHVLQGDNDVSLNFSPDVRPAEPNAAPAEVNLDLPAIVAAHREQRDVARASENLFELSGRAGPSRIALLIAPGQPGTPIERFTHTIAGEPPGTLVLERMLTNAEVTQKIRPLPSTETLGKHFRLVEATFRPEASAADRDKALSELFKRAVVTVGLRHALRNPIRRSDAQQRWGAIDWLSLERSAPIVSEKLRRLLLLPGPSEPLER